MCPSAVRRVPTVLASFRDSRLSMESTDTVRRWRRPTCKEKQVKPRGRRL